MHTEQVLFHYHRLIFTLTEKGGTVFPCVLRKRTKITQKRKIYSYSKDLSIIHVNGWLDGQSLMNDAQQKGLFMLADLQPRQQNYPIENVIQIAAGNSVSRLPAE